MNEAATLDFSLDDLRLFFAGRKEIELALLIGSRASGQVREKSDWDFAIQWRKDIPWMEVLELVMDEQYRFIIEFLLRPITQPK